MPVLIEPTLFPDSNRVIFEPHARLMPLSMVALHLQIVSAHRSNLLAKDQINGSYMYRDAEVPKPRLVTILAWNQIVRLGSQNSPFAVLPFLPSLTHEDEQGAAITKRGAKLHSLSRKSSIHIRDERDMITWGSIYMGEIRRVDLFDPTPARLTASISRSNFTESLLVPPGYFDSTTAQLSIRSRMEFLAQYGFVNTNQWAQTVGVPRVWRLLFQFLSAKAASEWLDSYQSEWQIMLGTKQSFRELIRNDYYDLISELIAERSIPEVVEESTKKTPLKAGERFGNIDDFFS